MKDPEVTLDHPLDTYRIEERRTSHTFFGYKDTISSNFTGIDWGKKNHEFIARTKRISLD